MALPLARVAWQAESNPHALAVLARHYPKARRYNDVREIDHEAPPVDIVCGGFPCQDISLAGRGAGIEGERSGLWAEFARVLGVLRPGIAFIENVAALVARGLDRVLRDLAEIGFDAEWTCVRASDVGAPHRRDRIFVLAYSDSERVRELHRRGSGALGGRATEFVDDGERVADAHGIKRHERSAFSGVDRETAGEVRGGMFESGGYGSLANADERGGGEGRIVDPGQSEPDERTESQRKDRGGALANAGQPGCEGEERRWPPRPWGPIAAEHGPEHVADSDRSGRELIRSSGVLDGERTSPGNNTNGCDCPSCYSHRWPPGPNEIEGWDGAQPAVRRSASWSPGWLRRPDALRLLGNSVCPQQAAFAFRALIDRVCGLPVARAA
ncbi:MAG TPA: DNA cytosine methyltransferase [Polyangia bacterium]|nr:DNA cytosine methyltransferase [Polyangia bacterium]